MELFTQLFGDLLAFVYHCFDRIVIYGYLSGLSRPEQVVHFFRNVVGVATVSKDVLSQPICVRCLGSVQFVADSPLEGAGFELSVPRERGDRFELSLLFMSLKPSAF